MKRFVGKSSKRTFNLLFKYLTINNQSGIHVILWTDVRKILTCCKRNIAEKCSDKS